LQVYHSIQEIDTSAVKAIVAGTFFQMRKPCISEFEKIIHSDPNHTLIVDVYPEPSDKFEMLLTQQERKRFFQQCSAGQYLGIDQNTFFREKEQLKSLHDAAPEWYYLCGLSDDRVSHLTHDFNRYLSTHNIRFEWHSELGYFYPLSGTVVHGNQIGRTLGYPTANLQPESLNKPIPPRGVYAGWVKLSQGWYRTMINIGIRPTLDMENVTIEANIFDFEGDLYGQDISLHFVAHIRNEMRFPSLSALKEQLFDDKEQTQKILKVREINPSDEIFLVLTNN
jgi:hypothetical protein